jgi:CxxC motif-containing protein
MKSEITCIICPIGCELVIHHSEGKIESIENFQCKKGKDYAAEELLNPVRTLTTTIRVCGGVIPLVSVKTDKPIPKDTLFNVMDSISSVEVNAPIVIGDILIKKVIDIDANIVATKSIEKEKK